MKKIIGLLMVFTFALGGLPSSARAADGYSYKDRVYETPDKRIKFLGVEKGKDYDGKPMVYVVMELTNKSKEKEDIYYALVDGVKIQQDTGSTTEDLDSAFVDDEASPYKEQMEITSKQLNPGKTVQAAIALELADETNPLLLEFEDGDFEELATEKIDMNSNPVSSQATESETGSSSEKQYVQSSSQEKVKTKKSTSAKKSSKKKKSSTSKKKSSKAKSKSQKKKVSKDKESNTKIAFQPKDVSDATIESISTYDDYLTMYQKIIENYLSEYEATIEGTALHDKASFEEQKKQYEESFEEQKEEYGSMRNKKIVGKSSLVDFLKDYRDSLKETVDSMKESLDIG